MMQQLIQALDREIGMAKALDDSPRFIEGLIYARTLAQDIQEGVLEMTTREQEKEHNPSAGV